MVNVDLPWEPLYMQSGGEAEVDSSSLFYYYGLASAIGFTLMVHAFEAYLDGRQRSAYKEIQFPLELETTVKEIDEDRARENSSKINNNNDKSTEGDETEEKATASEEKDEKATTDTHKPLLPQLKEKFKSAQAYGLDKINFGMIAATYGTHCVAGRAIHPWQTHWWFSLFYSATPTSDVVESVTFLILGFLPFIWDFSCDIGHKFAWTELDNEIKMSLIFLFLTTIIGTITSLPFELYSTFQIEKKHGFNKQTLGLFFTDKIKSLVLTFVIGGPFLALLLHIIKVSHRGASHANGHAVLC
jgi:STE24 endopeptidase